MRPGTALRVLAWALLAASVAGGEAQAQAAHGKWRVVGFSESAHGKSLYMVDDAPKPGASPNTFRFVTIMVFEHAVSPTIAAIESDYLVDCATNATGMRGYASWNRKGETERGADVKPLQRPEAGSLIDRVAKAVCGGDYRQMPVITSPAPLAEGAMRFAERDAAHASLAKGHWQRIGSTGEAPVRALHYLDRNSISVDAAGRRTLSALIVFEQVTSGMHWVVERKRFDCAAHTQEAVYDAGLYGSDGLIDDVDASGPLAIQANSVVAWEEVAACTGDWSQATPAGTAAADVAAEAFPQGH